MSDKCWFFRLSLNFIWWPHLIIISNLSSSLVAEKMLAAESRYVS